MADTNTLVGFQIGTPLNRTQWTGHLGTMTFTNSPPFGIFGTSLDAAVVPTGFVFASVFDADPADLGGVVAGGDGAGYFLFLFWWWLIIGISAIIAIIVSSSVVIDWLTEFKIIG